MPSGHWATLTPSRMYFVESAHAELAGIDLGTPVRATMSPTIGAMRRAKQTSLCRRKGFLQARLDLSSSASETALTAFRCF